jgi:hypothetical protein
VSDVDFELLAASLRADDSDLDAYVEALAAKLEGAFPNRTRVERKGGLLGGRRRVRKLVVDLGDDRYELQHERGVECRRQSVVRGIALKTFELPLERWIEELSRSLVVEAGATGQGRAALERLLGV